MLNQSDSTPTGAQGFNCQAGNCCHWEALFHPVAIVPAMLPWQILTIGPQCHISTELFKTLGIH